MAAGPVLKLRLVDVYGKLLQQPVVVMCRNQRNGMLRSYQVPPGKVARIKDLEGAPHGLYTLQIDPAAYLPCGLFLNLPASGTLEHTVTFPIDPDRIASVSFPAFGRLSAVARDLLKRSPSVSGFVGLDGDKLYSKIDDIRRAGFLNIISKAEAVCLPDGATIGSCLETIDDLRGDRFFCTVTQTLRDDVKNAASAGLFREVDGSLHHPPAGFTPAGSFKTPENYGNLQLTFFASQDRWVADVDIDDAGGLAHAFQVLRNAVTGRPTHPFDIHEILMHYQSVDAGYRFTI